MKRFASAIALVVVVLASAPAGAAPTDSAKESAKEAYARGLRLHDAGDFRGAAKAFAEADALAPSPVALMAALDAAVEADDPLLGAELLDRSTRAEPTRPLAASIDAARRKLGGRAGRVRVSCPPASRCTSTIDGQAADGAIWITPGRHTVVVRVDDRPPREQAIDVRAGETFVVSPIEASAPAVPASPAPTTPPPSTAGPSTPEKAAPSTEPAPRSGLSPVVTIVGAAVAVGLGVGATVTGLSAGKKHDDFVAARCDQAPGPTCVDLRDAGEPLVLWTNVLIGGAIVSALATGVIAIAFTDWRGGTPSRPGRARAAPGGLVVDF